MPQITSPVLSPPLLLATDGSSSARLAQRLVRSIAELFQTQGERKERSSTGQESPALVTVLTVQPRISRRSKQLGKKTSDATLQKQGDPSTATLEFDAIVTNGLNRFTPSMESLTTLVQMDFPADFAVSLEVRQGRPASEILNCARTIQAGLIAVGHRGGGGMRELLLGSVSTAIARYAPCSVLVARSTADTAPEPGLSHVLLVIDGSPATQQAIAATRQLVPTGIQRVTLLHIQAPLNANYLIGPFVSPTPSWQLNQSLQTVQKEQGEQILEQARANLDDANLDIHTRMHTGDPGPLICQVAQEQQVNLIVLGSDPTRRSLLSPLQAIRNSRREAGRQPSSRSVLRNTRLGITEDYVIHYAPCPVLLCRATRPSSMVGL